MLWFICGPVTSFTDPYCGSIVFSVDVTPLSPFFKRMPLGIDTQFVFDEQSECLVVLYSLPYPKEIQNCLNPRRHCVQYNNLFFLLALCLSLKHSLHSNLTTEALQICSLLTDGWNILAAISICIIVINIPSGMYYGNLLKSFFPWKPVFSDVLSIHHLCAQHLLYN